MLQIDVLLAASHVSEEPQLSDQQKEVLEQIEKRLNEAIEKFEGDGGFIRLNDRYLHVHVGVYMYMLYMIVHVFSDYLALMFVYYTYSALIFRGSNLLRIPVFRNNFANVCCIIIIPRLLYYRTIAIKFLAEIILQNL